MAEKEVRLIDANALEKALEGTIIRFNFDKVRMFRLVENAPTIDPESLRPHGKWALHKSGNGTCSECHFTSIAVWDFDRALPYCPHCGAKMDIDSEVGNWMQNWN